MILAPDQTMKPTAPFGNNSAGCHDTLPWLISFSLDGLNSSDNKLMTT